MTDDFRFDPLPEDEDAPMELDDVLEPFDGAQPLGTRRYQGGAFSASEPDDFVYPDENGQPLPEDEGYSDDPYEDDLPYEEEYSEYHEELDREQRARSAIGAFNLFSMLAGMVVVLTLVAMLFSLVSWLRADVVHSIALLQSGIQ